ncbi:MAG TPA: AI-2E family transporter [Ignavibacteriaceae bacterium]|nr:AI-2E family transporter [Ignavibacteriaceae bacterium]
MNNDRINLKLTNIFLGIITAFIIMFVLIEIKSILMPITFAIILTFLFHPVVDYALKYKIPKSISILVILMLVMILSYLFISIITASISSITLKSSFYLERLTLLIQSIIEPLDITMDELLAMLQLSREQNIANEIIEKLFSTGIVQQTFVSVSAFLGDVLIVTIFWLFMIFGKSNFDLKLHKAFGTGGSGLFETVNKVNSRIQQYIFIKTIISLVTGFIASIILAVFGVDFALLFGFLTFALNYIPNVGSMVATIFPVIIILLQFGFGFYSVLVISLLSINQFIIGNFIEPHYLGKHLNLSPVFVLISLIFWGWIWGITGMFLAVPIAAILKIVFGSVDSLKPFAMLMGSNEEE